jgi:hypothetical protein
VLLTLAVFAAITIAAVRDPIYWKRFVTALSHGGGELPLSFYEPRQLVAGGNVPPAPRVSPELESLDPRPLNEAARYAQRYGTHALIVTRHGHIVFEEYWSGTKFDTLEDSQGFSRTLTALLIGIAISDRKIGWPDEPIGNFIAQWSNDPRGKITVRNLLQMSSGLSPATPDARFTTDVLKATLKARLAGKPGEIWAERAADPQLLALVIERATKEKYADYLSEALWRRLGAADAWLWMDREGGTPHADCCMLVRQGDWIRLGELLATNGRYQGDEIVAPGWIPQMLLPAKGNANYGSYLRLGVTESASEPYAAPDAFLVSSGGYRLWVVPSMQLVILRTGPALIGAGWDDSHIPNLIIRGGRDFTPAQARPGSQLKALVPNH